MRPKSVTRSPIRTGYDVLSVLIKLGGTTSGRSSVHMCLGRRRMTTGIFYSSMCVDFNILTGITSSCSAYSAARNLQSTSNC